MASRGLDIWVLKSNKNTQYWKRKILESWNIILNLSIFSVGGCWGQMILFFWKLVEKLKWPNLQKPLYTITQSLKLLPLRPIYFHSFQYETSSMYVILNEWFLIKKSYCNQNRNSEAICMGLSYQLINF